MDDKVKHVLPTPQSQSAESAKKGGWFQLSSGYSSSATHPSTLSSTRLKAAAMLTEIGDILYKIPSRFDPNQFSDDDDDEEEKLYDGKPEEESHFESNENHSLSAKEINKPIGNYSTKYESSVTQKELPSSSNFRSADPLYKVQAVPPKTERSVVHKQDGNTIDDFNWRKKAVKSNSHQANSSIKQQQPVTKKTNADELSNNRSTKQKNSSKSSETRSTSRAPLQRIKLVESAPVLEENIVRCTGQTSVTPAVKSHGVPEQLADASLPELKPNPQVSKEGLKSNQDAAENKSNDESSVGIPKEESQADGKSVGKFLMPDEVITVNNKSYMVLTTLGSGGSCKVYSVYDPKSQSVYAVKCVNLGPGDKAILDGYKKEIQYLKKLKGSNRVIKMFDYEYLDNEIRLLLEKGDTDFSHYIANEMKIKPLSPIMIKFYWSQMLEAVAEIHKLGIVHSDLKPANFLLVAGHLKLIDFGIAASVPTDMTSAIREVQVGTMNFISPEALTCHTTTTYRADSQATQYIIKIGVKSDVWSLGCILYTLVYGHTPFHNIKILLSKMRAILSDDHCIPFPPIADPQLLDVLKCCLKRNPKQRASVEELLNHPYLTSEAKSKFLGTPRKSQVQFQDMLAQIQSLTPGRMSVVTEVLQKMQSAKK